MAASPEPEIKHEFADFWGVHAERDGQPWLVDWAKTEADAKAKKAEAEKEFEAQSKADAEQSATEVWVMQMTQAEVESFQVAGLIPS